MPDRVEKPLGAYVSFGGGVQSSALALLVAERDPRRPSPLPRDFDFDAPLSTQPVLSAEDEGGRYSLADWQTFDSECAGVCGV